MNNPDFIKEESISLPVLVALSLPFLSKSFFSLFVFNMSLLSCKKKLTFIVCQGGHVSTSMEPVSWLCGLPGQGVSSVAPLSLAESMD